MTLPHILIDNKIPYIKGVFEPYARVSYLSPVEIDHTAMQGVDVLVTRTRTLCNSELLADSPCQFIATATIGYDHIDTTYCKQHGIEWCNAPGCNASSVTQYIVSALMLLQEQRGEKLENLTIGIVGVGHVGSSVAEVCRLLGMRVLLNDPPRQAVEGDKGFVSLQDIAQQSDVITFHTPLIKKGEHATHHLADSPFFERCQRGVTIINTARGAVVDNKALYRAYTVGMVGSYILDCWENEPHIDNVLLEHAFIATPHIAGYSADGKCNATRAAIEAVAHHLELSIETSHIVPPPAPFDTIDLSQVTTNPVVAAQLATYHPMIDMQPLVAAPHTFELLRGNYPLRREARAYKVVGCNQSADIKLLQQLGFTPL